MKRNGKSEPILCLPYVRVSDKGQEKTGDGKNSQEHRLRRHAADLGYVVERVFSDVKSAGGHFKSRPGIVELLDYLDANKGKRYVILIDDLKRFSRDAEFYWPLRRAISRRGGRLESPNFRFEDSPEGRHQETSTAASGQLEREQGARQTRQKMQARLERGYAVFNAPLGYTYVENPDPDEGGMILVKEEPYASILQEVLQGYASGRFSIQAEVKRFLESQPEFPHDRRGGVTNTRVTRILTNLIYAGYVDYKPWGVPPTKAKHEPLINFETFQRIQDRLRGKAYAPARADLSRDFPLRGSVRCGCQRPLTSCWTKGRTAEHPYYLCFNRGCASYGKSIRRDVIESEFAKLLASVQPPPELFKVAEKMLRKLWERSLQASDALIQAHQQELVRLKKQIAQLLDRVVQTQNDSVVAAYEERISELERQRIAIEERIEGSAEPKTRTFDETLRTAFGFLAKPLIAWQFGDIDLKRMVLKLTFAEDLVYVRNEGFRTANLTLPFKVLENFVVGKVALASPRGFEPRLPP